MRAFAFLCLLAAAVATGLGCDKSSRIDLQLTTRPTIAQEECQAGDQIDFIECMDRQASCTFAQAVRAVAMFINGSDVGSTFEERYDYLLERGVVRPAWQIEADQWIDRGTLSFMLYKTIELKGGINMCLFASWGLGDRRFAYRELRYRDLVQAGVDYHYISGPELITTLGKVDQFMRQTGRYAPEETVELGEKPHPTQTAP